MIRKIYHFLGSIYFAVVLIALTALFVVVGTFIESKTGSHLHASYFTYQNPLFRGLLALFFVNILISSLRRIPFKPRHIPFLITHLGLLMIIGGCLVKSYAGIQGIMIMKEGSGSSTLFFPSTYALEIESEHHHASLALDNILKFEDLTLTLLNKEPHASEVLEFSPNNERASLLNELRNCFSKIEELPPPLALLKEQSEKEDPAIFLCDYLLDWEKEGSWLFKTSSPFIQSLDLEKMPANWVRGSTWVAAFFEKAGTSLSALKETHLKIVDAIIEKESNPQVILTTLTNELFSLGNTPIAPPSSPSKELIFSAALRYLGLGGDFTLENASFDATVKRTIKSLPPSKKWEENTPKIELEVAQGNQRERITLVYDNSVSRPKWPIFNDKYRLRFQPAYMTIPHHIRLREARQINYPGTNQPYSYESDLFVDSQEKTISMNNVYETEDGYRFYMASFIGKDPSLAKRISLAVNKDPAKNILTYPGAILLSCGILLLFWFRQRGTHDV